MYFSKTTLFLEIRRGGGRKSCLDNPNNSLVTGLIAVGKIVFNFS